MIQIGIVGVGKQGAALFPDAVRAILEISDVNSTLVNDPLPTISIQGEGRSILGPVKWNGTLRCDQNASTAMVEVPDFALNSALIRDLVKREKILPEKEIDEVLDLRKMTEIGVPGGQHGGASVG